MFQIRHRVCHQSSRGLRRFVAGLIQNKRFDAAIVDCDGTTAQGWYDIWYDILLKLSDNPYLHPTVCKT